MEEFERAKEIILFYEYDNVNKKTLIEEYEKLLTKGFIFSLKNEKFNYAVEYLLIRLNEAENDFIKLKQNSNNTHKDRPRDIESEIKIIEKTIKLIEDYSTTKEGTILRARLQNGLNELKQIKATVRTKKTSLGNRNIRYGYFNDLSIFNHRVEYLETSEKYNKQAVNYHLEKLINGLKKQNIKFNETKLSNLFKSYFIQQEKL